MAALRDRGLWSRSDSHAPSWKDRTPPERYDGAERTQGAFDAEFDDVLIELAGVAVSRPIRVRDIRGGQDGRVGIVLINQLRIVVAGRRIDEEIGRAVQAAVADRRL
jgi:hypothetical protein